MSGPATDKYVDFQGNLRAVAARGSSLIFVTEHAEGRPTAVYRLDADKGVLAADALPAGGKALAFDDASLFVAGTDGVIYRGPADGGALSRFGTVFEPAPKALVPAALGCLAILAGKELVLWDRATGAEKARVALPEEGTALTADPSGLWLVVGTSGGQLLVLSAEESDGFLVTAQAKVHEGPVTVLAFEPDELRVLSGGVDGRLLTTHVRGTLEPEDRGGRVGHSDGLTALCFGEEARLYTAGRDNELKAWMKDQKRPSTQKDGVGRAVGLAVVMVQKRAHVVVAADDDTLRFFLLDGVGKVAQRVFVYHDAWARVEHDLEQRDAASRAKALDRLVIYPDSEAIELLYKSAQEDDDHGVQVHATELLAVTNSRRAVSPLENLLARKTEGVRRAALEGLRKLEGLSSLRPLEKALAVRKADVGVLAVDALVELAKSDDLAQAKVLGALDLEPTEVRHAALLGLERLFDKDRPDASLFGLKSRHPDLRQTALRRFFQRNLLERADVRSALRRAGEDQAAPVRHLAFLISILARPALAKALRALDKDLHRQLFQVETFGQEVSEDKIPKAPKAEKGKLPEAELEPLVEALASRALDTSVEGASCLALLSDPRAFGCLLQLSRESDDPTRIEACRALAKLGDPRAVARLRLMLRDGAEAVRDAAFSALSRLLDDEPLTAASAALLADHEDVRRRGLQLLVKVLRKDKPKELTAPGLVLLARALNDGAEAVRGEAFKATLNLQVGKDAADTLRFARRSLHLDIRREVLTEAMGQIGEPWGWPLVLEFFGDPDPGLRAEVLEFVLKKGKDRGNEPFEAALASPFADTRLAAAQALAKKLTAAGAKKQGPVLELLRKAMDDEDKSVRLSALSTLEAAEDLEAVKLALVSRHEDVRVRAAAAKAAIGDAVAFEALASVVNAEVPKLAERAAEWRLQAAQALAGLAELGDPRAAEVAKRRLHDDDAALRRAAARTLAWTADQDVLRAALEHSDPQVKIQAAYGLALLGDPLGVSLLTASAPKKGNKRGGAAEAGVDPSDALVAAVALGNGDVLLGFADHSDKAVRARALRILLLLEWREEDGVPDRCLAALTAADARVRLTAARALEHFGNSEAFGTYVREVLGDRGDHQKRFELPLAAADDLALALTFGEPRLKARATAVLAYLDGEDQGELDRASARFSKRFASTLDELRKAAAKRKPAKLVYDGDSLKQLVVGAYVGLSRQGRSAEASIRQTALARLVGLGEVSPGTVEPVFTQALSDQNAAVRKQAFDGLVSLGMEVARLSAEALATGYADVGGMALERLSADAGPDGIAVLEDVMRRQTDGLQDEAFNLLVKRIGEVETAKRALDARSENLRGTAGHKLSGLLGKEEPARSALRDATQSRYADVRRIAVGALAQVKDGSVFEPAVALLNSEQREDQRVGRKALVALGDARSPAALLERIKNDASGTAEVDDLLEAVGSMRLPESLTLLEPFIEQEKTRSDALQAALALSGHDQYLGFDADEEDAGKVDENWLKGQHPRNDALLARTLELAFALGELDFIESQTEELKYAKGAEVDGVLAKLVTVSAESLRREAVEVVAFRARRRGGPIAPLKVALASADPQTSFLGAVGLARVKQADGLSVLLSAVDLVEDLDDRIRAVSALGELGDARALDVLLRLAGEEGHALQEAAAEALGYLGKGPQAERILTLLERLAKGDGEVARCALKGLRHVGGTKAWAVIRSRAEDDDWQFRQTVAELLGFDDDPQSREILIKRIREDHDNDVIRESAISLKRLYGPESLEPDYVFLQGDVDLDDHQTLERLAAGGDPARLLEVLSKLDNRSDEDELRDQLIAILLARQPIPVDAALAVLELPDDRVGEVAAQLIGRALSLSNDAKAALVKATEAAIARYQHDRKIADEEGRRTEILDARINRLGRLVWACGRAQVGGAALVTAARLDGDRPTARAVRLAAVTALAEGFAGADGLAVLEAAAAGTDALLRPLAAAAVRKLSPERAASLVEVSLSDRGALDQLVTGNDQAKVGELLRAAALSVHVQGVALPHLVTRGDVVGLAAALADRKLPEATRLGALEALARIATVAVEEPILAVAKREDEDDGLRKAAWRALRRARRARAQAEVKA